MKRKDFLKGIGLAGLGLSVGGANLHSVNETHAEGGARWELIPSETEGPFPLDLTENSTFFRQDIREDQTGIQLNLRLKVLGLDNCSPMSNVRVNIWHCSNIGVYSGYNTGNNPGDANATHLRGYQFTDSNGEVEFITIFPGWYNGRICHIHFQVYVSSSYAAVSQLTFPVDIKNGIYTNNSSLYPNGTDPMALSNDNIFSDGYEQQMATLEENSETGGYSSYLEVSVKGEGTTTGVGHIERETAKVFDLGQNYPNPYLGSTTVPITLKQACDVQLELWDVSGRKVATIMDEYKTVGSYDVEINPEKLGLKSGTYIYQLVANNGSGTFRIPKVMTVYR